MSDQYEVMKYRLADPFGGGNRPARGEGRGPSGDLHPALGLLLAVAISIIFWTGLVSVVVWVLT